MDRRTLLLAAGAATLGGCGEPPRAPVAAPSPQPAGSPVPSSPAASSPAPRTLPAEVDSGPRDVAAVALTFHGQGEPGVVGGLLDALAAAQVKATVLAVGTWLQQQPQLARRVVADGHELGNHTLNHADIKSMSDDKAYAEIAGCAEAVRSVSGQIGRWFRPSQTQHSTARIRAQAARAGYATCLSYDVDSLDYTDPGPDAVVRTTLQGVRNGSIVSLHFGHAGTVTAIPKLLAGLRDRGLRPVTASELLA
ncbi:polysaccharide deacetylase family protein [Dactylosporangium vinaceum]|uniref:Polysaccharide deacetylase family protein n=1 Tax=Dactylosporangium vinaceum TaxID=53362 RepID=A0ABV5MDS3_9ACTN|nr:polysaccharide deacetylase family protein [Dactylosporangium vinaceum]UAC01074.1 polysaccharide deacetylase family protein [Dactylosporangium vinaceum]